MTPSRTLLGSTSPSANRLSKRTDESVQPPAEVPVGRAVDVRSTRSITTPGITVDCRREGAHIGPIAAQRNRVPSRRLVTLPHQMTCACERLAMSAPTRQLSACGYDPTRCHRRSDIWFRRPMNGASRTTDTARTRLQRRTRSRSDGWWRWWMKHQMSCGRGSSDPKPTARRVRRVRRVDVSDDGGRLGAP